MSLNRVRIRAVKENALAFAHHDKLAIHTGCIMLTNILYRWDLVTKEESSNLPYFIQKKVIYPEVNTK